MTGHYFKGLGRVAREAVGAENVIEEPGAATRGHDGMDVIESIIIHHTAGSFNRSNPADYNSRETILKGHPGAKGPLAHFGVGRVTGKVYWFAAGLCAHAGKDSLVLARKYRNVRAIGIEIENNGVDEPYSPVAYGNAVALAAQLVIEFGLKVSDVVGHKEIALTTAGKLGRKTDPSFDMHKFRSDVTKWIASNKNGPAQPGTALHGSDTTITPASTTTEKNMTSLTTEQEKSLLSDVEIIKRSTTEPVVQTVTYAGLQKPSTVAGALADAHTRLRNVEAKVDGNVGELEEIKRILTGVAEAVAVIDAKINDLESTHAEG